MHEPLSGTWPYNPSRRVIARAHHQLCGTCLIIVQSLSMLPADTLICSPSQYLQKVPDNSAQSRQPAQEAQSEVDPAAPEPAAAEAAPAGEEHGGLAAEVTPAAEDSSAMAGSPIAEAVVALQQIMEPAPVPSPVLEDGEHGLYCIPHIVLEHLQTAVILLTTCSSE